MPRLSIAVSLVAFTLASCVSAPEGNFLEEDGFFIRSYKDGSARVALGTDVLSPGWSIDCRVDSMSDRRSCKFYGEELFVFYGTSSNPIEVCILSHDFPGRRGMIRVDDYPPVNTGIDGCTSAASLLPQLRSGTTVTLRYVEWPYDYPKDASEQLSGFNKAMDVVARIRAGTMPIVQ
jgi:hypothetical protein